MHLLIDHQIPLADAFFAELGHLERVPGREIDASAAAKADILIVRSVTPVDEALLADSRVRFVGTCTIGTDHVDRRALEARGIGFASAPGCNAEAVVDYVLSSLLLVCERKGVALDTHRVGIVGVGNVGGRLHRRLAALGVECLLCDPPRAKVEGSDAFVDLDTLLEAVDIVCLHTPLVRSGAHATYHLLDATRIAALEPGTILLNAGRGDCLDGEALCERLEQHGDLTTILDVWEHEPAIDETLWRLVDIATPHIAGHSLDGKMRGTEQVYQALMEYLGLPLRHYLADLAPPPALPRLTLDAGYDVWEALRLCVRTCYDVRRDVDSLGRESRRQGMATGFDHCRAHYPLRREFSTLEVELKPGAAELAPWLTAVGFRVTMS
ncbi:erythronate-4-phosphate dehydrogenase [Litchfieldella qijiaojingensis]|uniref:Erythronate-4-phosphate dehydrogenase n=1 Tax=Litchfieldella qijiaojingensis TaxID=980347 RepID=A0ABQ2Z9I6_9GAMM|nr:4-phosphoerythronate dehydrogenase PdxB [Halomonas qijiaojingensis]GGY05490.1 erythronate-4-phosphate dehydrogenase [Halomonas qijiaojingensis]